MGTMKAIEFDAVIDERGQIKLGEPLKMIAPGPVRVILLFDEAGAIDELDWLHSAAQNPVFAFLKEPAEDIYSPTDGRPFDDQR